MLKKTVAQINEKIKNGTAVVVTAEEIIGIAEKNGYKKAAEMIDVVTTGTFGPMCSSGVFINFGHSSPPIKMQTLTLNDVPAYAGLAAVDAYIGATELSLTQGIEYGGGHVIEELVAGKDVALKAKAHGTDCYPRKEIETTINKNNVNQIYMYNPRNAYQNYPAATNSTEKTIYTYMGTLLPEFGNITYSTAGELSPLLNDPYYRTIGLGTRIFLGGAQGYVTWEGTQHNPEQKRGENGVPLSLSGTIAVSGDLKDMSTRYVRGAVYDKYGVSLFVGIGIPIPIIDEEILKYTTVKNCEIRTALADKSGKESLPESYTFEELQSGSVNFRGREIKTAPLSSISRAREIANVLKEWIEKGDFLLTEAVAPLPQTNKIKKLDIRGYSKMKKVKVKLHFPRKWISKPLMSEVISRYGIIFNILHADISYDSEGTLIAELSGDDEAVNNSLDYIDSVGVQYKLYNKSIIRDEDKCIDCGACTAVCPSNALTMDENNELKFDKEKCLVCELCIKACPLGIISTEF